MRKRILLATVAAGLTLATTGVAHAADGAIYDAIPDPLPGNVPSLGFQATSTSAVGDLIQISGSDRDLDSVTVTMSSWACEEGSWNTTCTTTPGATFPHPVALSLYNVGENGAVGEEITSVEQTFEMPYRPSPTEECSDGGWWSQADGSCMNGLAFNVTFDMRDANVSLPDEFIYAISYNTQSYGANPLGVDGPYNSLNVGLNTDAAAPYAGVDVDPDVIYWDSTYLGRAPGLNPDSGWTGYTPAVRFSAVPSGPTTADECKNGGFEAFGFANQGQCVASVNANERAGK